MKVDEILDLAGLVGTWGPGWNWWSWSLKISRPGSRLIDPSTTTNLHLKHSYAAIYSILLMRIPPNPPKKWQRLPGIVVVGVSLRRFDGLPFRKGMEAIAV